MTSPVGSVTGPAASEARELLIVAALFLWYGLIGGLLVATIVFVCVGCGRMPGPAVACVSNDATECGTDDDAALMMSLFANAKPEFDVHRPLLIYWYPSGLCVDEAHRFDRIDELEEGERCRIGETYSDEVVAVNGTYALAHELMHVHYTRAYKDGDADHAAGDGPWTEEDDQIIRDVGAAYYVARGRP